LQFDGVDTRYLLHFFNSPQAIESMLTFRVTTALPNISLTNAREFILPLPPLAEQRRIVAKVDQLITYVDQLESQIDQSHSTAESLKESVVAEMTVGK
jgi:type I restriction enzyme S subunit